MRFVKVAQDISVSISQGTLDRKIENGEFQRAVDIEIFRNTIRRGGLGAPCNVM